MERGGVGATSDALFAGVIAVPGLDADVFLFGNGKVYLVVVLGRGGGGSVSGGGVAEAVLRTELFGDLGLDGGEQVGRKAWRYRRDILGEVSDAARFGFAVVDFGMALEAVIDRIDATTAVVTMSGSLTLGTALKVVDTKLQQLVQDGVSKLVVDVTACAYIDSAGLGTLVYAYGVIQEKGGSVRLCGGNERVGALLKLTKMDGFMPCDADSAASLAAIG